MQKVVLGKYKVLDVLGSGLGSKVFLTELEDKKFVVKLLLPSFAVDSRIQEEIFKREVHALSKLQSPLVPKLVDYGFDKLENAFYLVTEYIKGERLSEILAREGQLPALKTLEISAGVLAALDYYHQKGLVHRDVKPSNIIISEDEIIRLVDFGIAKDLGEFNNITLVNSNIGTPEYVSPEMANSEETDYRSDFYSLGVVLYECLAGTTPFKSKSPMHTLLLVLTASPPPLPFREDIPPELEEIVMKALAKKKSDRHQSSEEFLADIQRCYEIIKKGFVRKRDEVEVQKEKPKVTIRERKSQNPVIYCLDDQVFILNILKHILSTQGYEVVTFTNWDSLHEALEDYLPDLVVTDVQMPEVNGVRVCQLLKQAYPGLKVVLFSNVYEDDLAKLQVEAGADSWISKSWTPDVWLTRINEIFYK